LVYSGLLLGGTGVVGGIAFGCIVSWIMTATRAVRFPPGLARVYMVDSIPLIPTLGHVAAIAGTCLIIVFLSSVWPAWKTSRQDPVTSLRAA
jgi:lipoprotein-releasing system permease protein